MIKSGGRVREHVQGQDWHEHDEHEHGPEHPLWQETFVVGAWTERCPVHWVALLKPTFVKTEQSEKRDGERRPAMSKRRENDESQCRSTQGGEEEGFVH